MKLGIILASFIIVILFLVVLAIFLERYWRNYQKEQALKHQENNPTVVNSLAESVVQWATQLRTKMQPAQPDEDRVKQFREWVTHDLSKEPALQSWLLALPDPGLALLTDHIAAFCQEMNFDLKWLLEQQVTIAPELKSAMQAVILDYCRACQKAVPAQKDAKLFTTYQQLLKNPNGREEQALGRTLYANLTTQGLTTTPAADLINATEKERQQQAIQAIQQIATKDWAQFAQILQATITPNRAGAAAHNGHHRNGVPLQPAGAPIASRQEEKKTG